MHAESIGMVTLIKTEAEQKARQERDDLKRRLAGRVTRGAR